MRLILPALALILLLVVAVLAAPAAMAKEKPKPKRTSASGKDKLTCLFLLGSTVVAAWGAPFSGGQSLLAWLMLAGGALASCMG